MLEFLLTMSNFLFECDHRRPKCLLQPKLVQVEDHRFSLINPRTLLVLLSFMRSSNYVVQKSCRTHCHLNKSSKFYVGLLNIISVIEDDCNLDSKPRI